MWNPTQIFRKLAKELGLVIPRIGSGQRFVLPPHLLRFLVAALVEPVFQFNLVIPVILRHSREGGNPSSTRIMNKPIVYRLSSKRNGILYIGVLSHLEDGSVTTALSILDSRVHGNDGSSLTELPNTPDNPA